MSSLLTNTSAISAVSNLSATQKSLATVQSEISTGLRVASASDNAAYYSIATTLRTQTGQLGAVGDALNIGNSILGTAVAAYSNTTTLLQAISNQLVTGKASGTGLSTIQTSIDSIVAQLKVASVSASFNGVNLLNYDTSGAVPTQATVVNSVSGSGTSTATVSTATLDFTSYALTSYTGGVVDNSTTATVGILENVSNGGGVSVFGVNLAAAGTTSGDIDNAIKAVNGAIAAVTTANAQLGAQQTNISLQQTFIGALKDSITTGIGSLVDANLNEASTKLSALQTQQSLGIQSLSIANQNSQSLLKLFQ